MVAAMCMVLYGYDASVFNSVQALEELAELVQSHPVGPPLPRREALAVPDCCIRIGRLTYLI